MRAARWALALTATGIVGAGSMALVLPGSALADSGAPADDATRYTLTARGDAFFFQVDGDEIPASPKNDAGSATASVATTNSGGSKSFAGAPYYGNTVQTLPGTANGIPNQFGAEQLQIPFAQLPGYVAVNSTSEKTKVAEEGQYYRVSAEALPSSGNASSSYGAPAALPAPNQQQSATAETKSEGSNVIAKAFGSSQGIVSGPLEIANSTALASISQVAGEAPKIESKTFGRFSVNGQEFGFDQTGFRYAGQGQSSDDAIKQANDALKAANIQIALAPVVKEQTQSGGTRYTIGGLMVTTTQDSPSGAGKFTVTYIVGRASISADVAKLGFAASNGAARSSTSTSTESGVVTSSAPVTSKSSASPSLDSYAPEEFAEQAAAAPTTVSTVTEGGVVESSDTGVAARAEQPLRTLGFVPAAQVNQGDAGGLMFGVLILAGMAMIGVPIAFSRFAGSTNG